MDSRRLFRRCFCRESRFGNRFFVAARKDAATGENAVPPLFVIDAQCVHQDILGIDTKVFMESFRQIAIILGKSDIIDIDGKGSAVPGEDVDDGHDDQGFQPLKGELLVDLAGIDEHGDQGLTLLAGLFLLLQGLLEEIRRNRIHADQHLTQAHAVIAVVGTDDVTVAEDQPALPLAPHEFESSGFSG